MTEPPPAAAELERIFFAKHGNPLQACWAVQRRYRFRYFRPDDCYEALLDRFVQSDTTWLDVGGGDSICPHNPKLAQILAGRCRLLVGVDPSDNIQHNPFVQERSQCLLEEYKSERRFDLIIADAPGAQRAHLSLNRDAIERDLLFGFADLSL